MKTRIEIFDEIQEVIATSLKIPQQTIADDTKIADLTEDSIQLFELLLSFEKKYQMETTYEDVVKLNTVGDIVTYVACTVYMIE
jgi:acyl carrier protein